MELTALVRKATLGLSLGLGLAIVGGSCADAVPSYAQRYAQDAGAEQSRSRDSGVREHLDGRNYDVYMQEPDSGIQVASLADAFVGTVPADGNLVRADASPDVEVPDAEVKSLDAALDGTYWPDATLPDAPAPPSDGNISDENINVMPDALAPCLQLYGDADGDGFGAGEVVTICQDNSLPGGYALNNLDCNDTNNAIYPGALELCDFLNNDCDEATLDGSGEQAPYNTKQGGVCLGSRQSCLDGLWQDYYGGVPGYEANPEVSCDSLDNDCNLFVDDILARPSRECFDGVGECWRSGLEYKICQGSNGWSQNYFNCDAVAGAPAIEIGWDSLDQDCDGGDYSCPYFVDGSYNGLNGEIGSPTNPWNTIQEAINNADPDYCESILVLPGTYYETIIIVNKDLTLQSRDGAGSTSINEESPAGPGILYLEYSRIVIDGFTITGGYGVYSNNSHVTIGHNVIRGNHQGIAIWSWGGEMGRIYNNIIVGNKSLGNEWGDQAGGIAFVLGGSLTIENNVIVGNAANLGGGGIFVDFLVNALVQNNIIAFNSPGGIHDYYGDSFTNQYNCLFGNGSNNGGGNETNYAGAAAPGPGDLITNPLFVNFTNDDNWSNDDYHLQEGSPCRNAGNPAANYNDADGSVNDIGAYGGPDGEW